MPDAPAKFLCSACQRGYVWKPDQAGKRSRCKCGAVLVIPAESPVAPPPDPEPQAPEDDLYDIAEPAQQKPIKARPIAVPASPSATPQLGYQSAPTARQKARSLSRTLIDPNRDYYIPVALLVTGIVLYNAYYAIHYQLNLSQLLIVTTGLGIVAVLETAILVGFALVVAGPLGVSFGGIWTAILKLAATAILCDGIITWLDGFVARISGGFGAGFMGFGVVGFPAALGIYWVSLIYLFSMDPGDSWFVVVILSVFYRIVRVLLLILLLNLIFRLGSVRSVAATALASGSGGTPPPPSYTIREYKLADTEKRLTEARQYATAQKMADELVFVNRWYAAGAARVSYALVPVGIGQTGVGEIFVSLPDDPAVRAKCLDIAKAYYAKKTITYDPADLKDTGDPYLLVGFDYCPVAPEVDPDNGN